MMAGGYAACQPARKTMQAGACGGEGLAPRFAPLPVLFPSTYFDVHFRQISFLTEKSCLEPALLRN